MAEGPAAQLPVVHERSFDRRAFVMKRDDRQVGELTYTMTGNRMTINHTGVDVALRLCKRVVRENASGVL